MKIILRYILKNIQERKTRTAVMLLSVVLSSALLFVSLSIGASYESAQLKMSRGMAGTATITVSAKPQAAGQAAWIKDSDIPGSADIKHKVGILETPALYNEDGYFESFDLLAADLDGLNKINAPRLISGSIDDFNGYQIVLPEKFTSKFGISVGDIMTLKIAGNPVSLRVAAIAAYDTVFLRHERGFTALLTKDAMEEILGVNGEYSRILIEPAKHTDTATLIANLSGSLSGEYRVGTVVNEKQIAASAREKSMPFLLISFFALTMSVFIIYSSYKVITMERIPVIGTFRSIGATENTVTKILVLESLLYGTAGGILGIASGYGLLSVMLRQLEVSMPQGIEIPLVVSYATILAAAAVAVMVSMLSAYIPIRRVSKLPVKDVVLGLVEESTVSNRAKLVFGAILLVVSIVLPNVVNGNLLVIAGGCSLFTLIVAVIIVLPLIVTAVAARLEPVYGAVFGNTGWLAARNLKWNKNINQNVTLLVISLSALIAINFVGDFVNSYIGDVFKDATLDGFADTRNIKHEFVEQVEAIEGMESVLPVYVFDNISMDGKTLSRVEATTDLSQYDSLMNIKFDNVGVQNDVETRFHQGRNAIINSYEKAVDNVNVGDTIRISAGGVTQEYSVIGSFKSRVSGVEIIIPAEYAVSDYQPDGYGLVLFRAENPDAAATEIRTLFGSKENWTRTVAEFNADALGIVGAFLAPLNQLTYFILFLCIVGVINNLLIQYIQKKRSIAMYKSVGLSKAQYINMTLIEGFTSGLIGGIIGSTAAWLEIKTIFLVAAPRIPIELDVSPSLFIMAGVMGIAITLIGSVVPVFKGSKMRVIEEIRFE